MMKLALSTLRQMTTSAGLLMSLFHGLYWTPLASAMPQESVADVGTRLQLLIDRELIYDAQGVSFMLHPGKKTTDEPLLKPDLPHLAGEPLVLRFHLFEAELYTFAFRE